LADLRVFKEPLSSWAQFMLRSSVKPAVAFSFSIYQNHEFGYHCTYTATWNTCKPFAVLPRAPRKTGLSLPKGRLLRPPVLDFPPDPGLRVRGNLRGTSRPATCAEAPPLRHRSRAIRAPENQHRGAIAPPRPLVRAFELRHHDGGLRAPATQTGVSAPASSKEGARPLHHAGASGARMA
jgi:hypothetical protein